jgi:carotenoid cleavage dioxygenase
LHAPVESQALRLELQLTGDASLSGTFAQIGSNPVLPPRQPYHWFDGDGMIHAIKFQGKNATYLRRQIDTKGLAADQAKKSALHSGLLRPLSFANLSRLCRTGDLLKNTANTALVEFRGQLLATWYGGAQPYALNKDTLETLGQAKIPTRWGVIAHPKIDPATGTLVFVDRAFFQGLVSKKVTIQQVTKDGNLLRPTIFSMHRPEAMHDFAITANYALVLEFPLRAMARGKSDWKAAPAYIHIAGRSDPHCHHVFRVKPAAVLHTVNAYEEANDVVILTGVNLTDFDRGIGHLYQWQCSLRDGRVEEQQLDHSSVEFPRINDEWTGKANQFCYMPTVANQPTFLFDGLKKFDFVFRKTTAEIKWQQGWYGSEPVFVPKKDSVAEDDGYVLNWLHSDNSSRIVILDAKDFSVAGTVEIPCRVPVGFHCAFF